MKKFLLVACFMTFKAFAMDLVDVKVYCKNEEGIDVIDIDNGLIVANVRTGEMYKREITEILLSEAAVTINNQKIIFFGRIKNKLESIKLVLDLDSKKVSYSYEKINSEGRSLDATLFDNCNNTLTQNIIL